MKCPTCHYAHALTMAPIFSFRVLMDRPSGIVAGLFGARAVEAKSRLERTEVGYWAKCLGCGNDYGVTADGSFIPRFAPQGAATAPAPPKSEPRPAHLPDDDIVTVPDFR